MNTPQILFQTFKDWLESMHPEAIVGRGCYCEVCPVAMFLNETTHRLYRVYGGFYTQIGSDDLLFLPKWAADFVQNVDLAAGTRYINAKKALRLLEKVQT